jgi:hypothetical protein
VRKSSNAGVDFDGIINLDLTLSYSNIPAIPFYFKGIFLNRQAGG